MKIKLKTRADTNPPAGISKPDLALGRKPSVNNKMKWGLCLNGSRPCTKSKHLAAVGQGTPSPQMCLATVRGVSSSTD